MNVSGTDEAFALHLADLFLEEEENPPRDSLLITLI